MTGHAGIGHAEGRSRDIYFARKNKVWKSRAQEEPTTRVAYTYRIPRPHGGDYWSRLLLDGEVHTHALYNRVHAHEIKN